MGRSVAGGLHGARRYRNGVRSLAGLDCDMSCDRGDMDESYSVVRRCSEWEGGFTYTVPGQIDGGEDHLYEVTSPATGVVIYLGLGFPLWGNQGPYSLIEYSFRKAQCLAQCRPLSSIRTTFVI